MGLSGVNIGSNGNVKENFGGSGEIAGRMEEGLVEMVLAIGGNEGDEEGLGGGEVVAAEERREEGEEGVGGLGEGGSVGLQPFEEGNESCGFGRKGFGGEKGDEEGICYLGNVWG